MEPISPTRARVDGREVTLFCTNDYLGLAHHPDVVAAWQGSGAGASRLVSGTRPAHVALEEAISRRFGRPALLFPSGWQANAALFSTVLEAGELVVSDALNHASIIDGIRLSRARKLVVEHGRTDLDPTARLIVVEGLYSMDGDVPRFAEFPTAPWLAVDEAHSFATLGPGGLGAAAAARVVPDFLVGTLGKALGCSGAFVVGPPSLRELLISTGRAFVYTTAVPEPVARAALVALGLADDERRQRLAANARRLRSALVQLGIAALGEAHIVPVVVGPRVMEIASRLFDAGFFVPGIRWPTVPRGQERLRVTVSSEHSEEEIDRLVEGVGRAPAVTAS